LNGELNEEVFVLQPPDFVVPGREDKGLKLKKAVYGLHQAPIARYHRLDQSLLSMGFHRCSSDLAKYCRKEKGRDILVVRIYVDDLGITRSNRVAI
jgi:hypothetical protein